MRECDYIRFLFNDLKESTSHLLYREYHTLFEEELQGHYPFTDETKHWLKELYVSEKYRDLSGEDRSFLFEKTHPFLFLRDLATMNNWRRGYMGQTRRDSIAGLLFSMTPEVALEAALALAKPDLVGQPVSQWFDANQVMKNLDYPMENQPILGAWRACAYYFLYMHFTTKEQPPQRDELHAMLLPFLGSLDFGRWQGEPDLQKACEVVLNALEPKKYETLVDTLV